MRLLATAFFSLLIVLPISSQAQEGARLSFAGDQFASSQSVQLDAPIPRDAFAAGFDVVLRGPVTGDAHLAGFNVSQPADVGGDVYAAGFNVSITGKVGGDVTAMGNTVSIATPTPISGNVRLAAQTVTLSSEIAGAALVTAQTLTLAAPVKGDLQFSGENLSFGPNARVDGILTIRAPREIPVPNTVAAAERVKYEALVAPDYASEAGKTAEHVVRSVWPAVWATGLWWFLLVVIGLGVIALLPRLTQALQSAAALRPFRRIGLGLVTFAAVIGLVPVLALTILGIVLVPFALLFVVLSCALAYLAGTYLVGARIAAAFTPIDSNLKRAGVLVASVVILGLLGMIPVLGWLITLLVACFGFGVIATIIIARLYTSERPTPTAVAHAPEAV